MSNQGSTNGAGHSNEARLREAQVGELAQFTRAMEAMREALDRMDTRLQAVERATPHPNERQREGRHRNPQIDDLEDENVDYNEDDNATIDGVGAPRAGGRGGRGFGFGLGRGRGRWQDNQYHGRNRGYDDFVDRNLGNIKLEIPHFQGKSDPEAYLQWEKKVELI